MSRWLFTVICLALFVGEASAQVDSAAAQIAMLQRVTEATRAYAASIGLSREWVLYCLTEMNRKTRGGARDGSIPFGLNWNAIPDRATLDDAISVMENWQRSDQILCLARVRNELRDAMRPMKVQP